MRNTPLKTHAMTRTFHAFQRDVDATSAQDYAAFRAAGPKMSAKALRDTLAAHPGLRRYDTAFENVLNAVRTTVVRDRPAAWLVYNMAVVVKTARTTFAIDLAHRQDIRMAPLLDFALVTHNHDDHVGPAFLTAMDKSGKTIISNFLCNYGAYRSETMPGGYTRRKKVFKIGDVTIRTALSDHNGYLKAFTTTFEISVGDWTLYHTGDSCDIRQLVPKRTPDLWIVHPRCGLDVADGVRAFHPRRVAICHLCELGHPPHQWRWSLSDGLEEAARAEAAGAEAVVPLWGQRLV